jgi:hypothetical protein
VLTKKSARAYSRLHDQPLPGSFLPDVPAWTRGYVVFVLLRCRLFSAKLFSTIVIGENSIELSINGCMEYTIREELENYIFYSWKLYFQENYSWNWHFLLFWSFVTFSQLIVYNFLYIIKIYIFIHNGTCSYLLYPTFREAITKSLLHLKHASWLARHVSLVRINGHFINSYGGPQVSRRK